MYYLYLGVFYKCKHFPHTCTHLILITPVRKMTCYVPRFTHGEEADTTFRQSQRRHASPRALAGRLSQRTHCHLALLLSDDSRAGISDNVAYLPTRPPRGRFTLAPVSVRPLFCYPRSHSCSRPPGRGLPHVHPQPGWGASTLRPPQPLTHLYPSAQATHLHTKLPRPKQFPLHA